MSRIGIKNTSGSWLKITVQNRNFDEQSVYRLAPGDTYYSQNNTNGNLIFTTEPMDNPLPTPTDHVPIEDFHNLKEKMSKYMERAINDMLCKDPEIKTPDYSEPLGRFTSKFEYPGQSSSSNQSKPPEVGDLVDYYYNGCGAKRLTAVILGLRKEGKFVDLMVFDSTWREVELVLVLGRYLPGIPEAFCVPKP